MGSDYLKACDSSFYERFFALPEYKSANTIMLYYGVGTEPETRTIMEKVIRDGKRLCLPVVYGKGEMQAHEVGKISELIQGTFGIPEPSKEAKVICPDELDLVLVPAAAFDRRGFRLGKGGGYYDRYLVKTKAFTVGFAREKLLFDSVPTDEHDISVNCLITENDTLRL